MRFAALLAVACLTGPAAARQAVSPAWEAQQSGVTARLRGVSAVSDRIAWASGANGTVLRTLDGGATWQKLAVPAAERLDFRDVEAHSDRLAWLLSIGPGESSRIYRTADAGGTWDLQFQNTDPQVFLDAMEFWDDSRGIAFSDSVDGRFVIFVTGNGGRTWSRVPDAGLPPALPGEGAFAASGTNIALATGDDVWVGTTASRVLHSADGGRTWTVAKTPLGTGTSTGIFSIAFRTASNGVVVGGDYQKEGLAADNAAFTSDGGVTWTPAGKGLSGFRSVTAPLGVERTWIAIGPSGADLSNDDGRTWTPLKAEGYDTFSHARGTRTGWAAGNGGRIARVRW